jgi:hypothetical protein
MRFRNGRTDLVGRPVGGSGNSGQTCAVDGRGQPDDRVRACPRGTMATWRFMDAKQSGRCDGVKRVVSEC